MIRVLHIIRVMNMAGAETFIMNVYRHIDRKKIQFDFLVNTRSPGDYDKEIESLGGKIYSIPRYCLINQPLYKYACDRFFSAHPEHQIVHGHIGSSAPIYLPLAQKHNKLAIAHSHNSVPNDSLLNKSFNYFTQKVRNKADYYFACSPEAGIDRFGAQIVNSSNFSIVNNGIDIENYTRTSNSTLNAKRTLGVGSSPVFLHIGRFTPQKNHLFLLDVFAAIKKTLPHARLLLLGNGESLPQIKAKIDSLHLQDSVQCLETRRNVSEVLHAADVFIFPSLWEGLGIALVEAQAAGLPCIVSNTIPDLACMTPLVTKLSLSSAEQWAETCTKSYLESKDSYPDYSSLIREKGFDIQETADWLSDFYSANAR